MKISRLKNILSFRCLSADFSVCKELLFILPFILFNLLVAFWLYPGFSSIGTDGVVYALVGESIAEGNGISLYGEPHTIFGPLLPIFIAFFYLIIGNLELAAHAATIFFGLASIPLFYILVREIFSKEIALTTLPLFALSANFIWPYITVPTPQIAAGFFAMLTMLALFKISKIGQVLSKKDLIWFVVVGLSIGLSYLARLEYFLLMLPVLIYIYWIHRGNLSHRNILKCLTLVIVGFTIVTLPYIIFLHGALEQWTMTGKLGGTVSRLITGQPPRTGDNFIKGVSVLEEVGDGVLSKAVKSIPANLKRFFKHLRDAERSLTKTFGFIGIIFLAFGLRKLLKEKMFRVLWIMIISVSLLPLVVYVVSNIPNYLTQYLFVFIMLVGLGLNYFLHELKSWFQISENKYKIISCLLIAIVSFYFFFPIIQSYLFLPDDFQPRESKELGRWMKNNISGIEQETILSRKPNLSFYSGARFEVIPDIEVNELVSYMKDKGIRYVVIDNRSLVNDRSQFLLLLDPSINIVGLKLVHFVDFHDKKTLLYSVTE